MGAVRDGAVRVLVVEDDAATAQMLRSVLELEGMHVQVLHEPVKAEEAVAEYEPDLVVLDVMMPGRNGREVAADLRRQDSSSGPGIILLSALSSDEDVWEGWQAGADSYLTKPVAPDALVAECQRITAARAGEVGDPTNGQPAVGTHDDRHNDASGGGARGVSER